MSQRLDEFNKKFVYTKTNPENIVAAKKNALFFRYGNDFYLNHDGNIDGEWHKLHYRTVIIPAPPATKLIKFEQPYEVWLKTTDGFIDEFKALLPKTGWKFLSYKNVFSIASSLKILNWTFPPPSSSYDPIGNNNSRSYDENFFYAKIGDMWFRTPITTFTFPGPDSPENPYLYNNLPFVDRPRAFPVPPMPVYPGEIGDQSYDLEYFYVKPSTWKRSQLLMFYGDVKMTAF